MRCKGRPHIDDIVTKEMGEGLILFKKKKLPKTKGQILNMLTVASIATDTDIVRY